MAESVTYNNAIYIIPDVGESNWGQNLTNYFVAIPQGCFQLSGGTKPLTADLSFGSNFGILAKYFKSVSANAAALGAVRLANSDAVQWRNAANTADVGLVPNGADQLGWSGSSIIATYFASLSPPSQVATAGVLRLANTEAVEWRNTANSANLALSVDTSNNLLWNGDIISTSSASPVLSITGTANQVIASAATGNVTLSLPQSINAGASPTFTGLTLTASATQMVFGTGNQTGLTFTSPASARAYTVPDAGASTANFMLDKGNYTVTGTWTGVTLVTPALGTPASGALTNCTSVPVANATGTLAVLHGGTGVTTSTGTGNTVLSTSPALVTPTLGAASATSLSFSSTSGIIGTTTNNSAAAGSVGEYQVISVGLTNIPTANTWGDITSMSLTAGDWMVQVSSTYVSNGATFSSSSYMGVSTVSGNVGPSAAAVNYINIANPSSISSSGGALFTRFSLATTTTIFMKWLCSGYSVAIPQATGALQAWRVR